MRPFAGYFVRASIVNRRGEHDFGISFHARNAAMLCDKIKAVSGINFVKLLLSDSLFFCLVVLKKRFKFPYSSVFAVALPEEVEGSFSSSGDIKPVYSFSSLRISNRRIGRAITPQS